MIVWIIITGANELYLHITKIDQPLTDTVEAPNAVAYHIVASTFAQPAQSTSELL